MYVDDGFNHKYAGFNGEILEIKGTSIAVQIYDVGLHEDNSIYLVPLRFTFPKRNLTLLPDMNTETYFSMLEQAMDDLKNLISNGGFFI